MCPIEKFCMPTKSSRMEIEKQRIEYDQSREKARLVEEMPIGIDEKVEILLITAEAKSAAEIELFSDTYGEGTAPQEIDKTKIEEISKALKMLGLSFRMNKPIIDKIIRVENDNIPKEQIKPEDEIHLQREKIEIEIAGNERLMEELKKAVANSDDEKQGELYGFPKSAVEEYLKGEGGQAADLIGIADLPEEVRKADWSLFSTFMFSRNSWQEEIKTIRKWAGIVKKLSPEIYSEYVRHAKEENI